MLVQREQEARQGEPKTHFRKRVSQWTNHHAKVGLMVEKGGKKTYFSHSEVFKPKISLKTGLTLN